MEIIHDPYPFYHALFYIYTNNPELLVEEPTKIEVKLIVSGIMHKFRYCLTCSTCPFTSPSNSLLCKEFLFLSAGATGIDFEELFIVEFGMSLRFGDGNKSSTTGTLSSSSS